VAGDTVFLLSLHSHPLKHKHKRNSYEKRFGYKIESQSYNFNILKWVAGVTINLKRHVVFTFQTHAFQNYIERCDVSVLSLVYN